MKGVFFSIVVTCTFLCTRLQAQDVKQGDVVIHSDARLAVLVRKTHNYLHPTIPEPATPTEAGTKPPTGTSLVPTGNVYHDPRIIYTGKGFRVQIYNGPDRVKALAVKTQFMRRFPGVSAYLVYIAPAFRVKVGDYRLRTEAEHMLREANAVYSPSMIVPDMVTVTTY